MPRSVQGLVFLADENDIKYGSKVGKMSPEFRILMRGLVMFVMCTCVDILSAP